MRITFVIENESASIMKTYTMLSADDPKRMAFSFQYSHSNRYIHPALIAYEQDFKRIKLYRTSVIKQRSTPG